MLKVSHLTKIYKTKGGESVRALDDVSLEFPGRGMVFLLGKSGSGKSTLLNICGGLDSPTSGEIVVKGRSSRNFSQSDFDSYRNTFVGFVFQEYNILDEFTVEENIALALELQGKPNDRAAVQEILSRVDLAGFGKRKPNTLSGGQKQRIAIARALVKNPEIILADEPTGALDSATGKQVFDTLKRLSAQKLIVVVSHDREFAERYADRIVELKDGKIVADVTRTQERGRPLGENVTQTENALSIRRGAQLTDEDMQQIRAFLSAGDGEAFIVRGKSGAALCRQAAKITDDGSREVFTATPPTLSGRVYSAEEGKFIRSRLPARRAFRIGASGLKTKPLRLFFTVLLSVVSFVMFGLLSTMTLYDEAAAFRKTLTDSGRMAFSIGKDYRMTQIYYYGPGDSFPFDVYAETRLTKEEVQALGEQIGTKAAGIRTPSDGLSAANVNYAAGKNSLFYTARFSGFTSAEDAAVLPLLAGNWPEEGKNQLCVTAYAADSLLFYGLLDPDSDPALPYPLGSRGDLIGKKLVIGQESYTISGIADGGEIPAEYLSLRSEDRLPEELVYQQAQSLQTELKSGLYSLLIFDEQTTKLLDKTLMPALAGKPPAAMDVRTPAGGESRWNVLSGNGAGEALFFRQDQTALSRNGNRGELLLDASSFGQIFFDLCKKTEAGLDDSRFDEFTTDLYSVDPGLGRSRYDLFYDLFYRTDPEDGTAQEQTREALDQMTGFAEKWGLSFSVRLAGETAEADICGFLRRSPAAEDAPLALLDDETFRMCLEFLRTQEGFTEYVTDYVAPENAVYSAAVLFYDGSAGMADALRLAVDRPGEDGGVYRMHGPLKEALAQVNSLVGSLSEIFLWVGLILAVFSALLLSNFISVSISNKKKEIGILRAVGARGADVFKIFFSESLVISLACILLSSLGSIAACMLINNELSALLSGVSVFVFGPLSFLALSAVALGTAFIATFLPVWSAAKKKPVESIRAL